MRALLALLALSTPALSQPVACSTYIGLRDSLKNRFQETAIGGGITASAKTIIQVFASPSGKTFTVLSIQADGLACIIAAGRDWQPGTLPIGGQEG